MQWITTFLIAFFLTEWAAWAMHKYVMHGFLWCLHKDHHIVNKNHWWQWNDAFSIFFAIPSFLFILFNHLYHFPLLGAFGYGIMFYGLAYFFIHEIIIHRRIKIRINQNFYIRSLKTAHHIHHKVKTKDGAICFGMLIVPLKYFHKK